ncbi:MAG TPA: DHA2 family efflux MFS transporter permease subunit [Flavisolibacter sp.]|nr:DHA2 family efflux MFS transporter permease subunit [Flavisolibacter sp.]
MQAAAIQAPAVKTPTGFARFIIVLTTVTAAVMELIDTSIVNVGLNQIAGSLGVTIEDVSWVITAYAIANVIIIPLTGFLAEYFGRKTYYIVSMIIFTIASFFCAESSTLVELVIWRFVQGVGGGALLSTSQAILFDAFEPKDRPMASGLFGMGLVLGPTLGPTLGGYLIDNYSWPLIFTINIPIGIIATLLSFSFIGKKKGEGKRKAEIKIDYTGISLLMVGIGCLQYVLERGESEDWFNSRSIQILSALALFGLAGFIWRELKVKHPAVDLHVLKNRNLAFTTIFTFVTGLGLFTSVFVYPVLAQRVLGWTPYETGLSLMAPTLIAVVMMPVIGKLMSKGVTPIPFVIAGFLLFAAYCFISGDVSPDASRSDFFFPLLLRGLGLSMVNLPLINQAVAGLKPKEYASGIALNNMIRQLGGAFGIALANNYIAHRYFQHRTDLLSNITTNNPNFQQYANGVTNMLASKAGNAAVAQQQALKLLDLRIDKQAYFLSYLDTFHIIAIFFIAVLPLVAFLRVKKNSNAAEAMKAAAEAH